MTENRGSRRIVILSVVAAVTTAFICASFVCDGTGARVTFVMAGPTCVIHGWVNDSVTAVGVEGAFVTAVVFDTEEFEMMETTTDEAGYYTMELSRGSTMVVFLAFGYYQQIEEVNTTGLDEYRLDVELDGEPTVPSAHISIDPGSNVSSRNPLVASVAAEDFNIIAAGVVIGLILEMSGDQVEFAIVDWGQATLVFDTEGYGDFEFTYEDDFFEGQFTWEATAAAAGYIVNDTSSEYVPMCAGMSINDVMSFGVPGYYSNDTLTDEAGFAWFDNDTGEYLGFEFGGFMPWEPEPLPDALPDDQYGVLTPSVNVLKGTFGQEEWGESFSIEDYMNYDEQLLEPRLVTELTFRSATTAPSGNYIAMFLVYDEAFNFNQSAKVFTVDTDAPVADAGDDQTVRLGDDATLSGAGSSDNIGIVNYEWYFRDGGQWVTLYGEAASYEFESTGEHTVYLTVIDGANLTGTDAMTVTVVDLDPPVAYAGADVEIDEGGTAEFDGGGSTDNVGVTAYEWVFENSGSTVVLTGETPSYVFGVAGVYTVTLTVWDEAGNSDSDTMTVTVIGGAVNVPPVADAGDDAEITAGDVHTFDGSGSSEDVVNYTWTFEYDGRTVELYNVSPSFKFDLRGTYIVNLTVTDDEGLVGYDEVVVTVVTGLTSEDYAMYALIAIVPAVVVAAAIVLLMRRRSGRGGDSRGTEKVEAQE